ncbi:alanine--tRNA ligase, partial [Sulfolobus sp. SCGC AB-777_L09]
VSIYAGGVPETAEVRLIEVKDWDIEGCGGTHLSNTSEIGAFKIFNVERLQDGVIRLEYVAGDVVSQYARIEEEKINTISQLFQTSPSQLEARVRRYIDEVNKKDLLLSSYRKLMLLNLEKFERVMTINDIKLHIITGIDDDELIKEIMRKITSVEKQIVVSIRGAEIKNVEIASSKDLKVDKIIEALRKLGGKGGGKNTYGSISISTTEEKIIDTVSSTVNSGI